MIRPRRCCCNFCAARGRAGWRPCRPHGRSARPVGPCSCVRCWKWSASASSATRAVTRLTWVEDESNADTHHDRNYLRHEVLPRLSARFPRLPPDLAAREPQLRRPERDRGCAGAGRCRRCVALRRVAGAAVAGAERGAGCKPAALVSRAGRIALAAARPARRAAAATRWCTRRCTAQHGTGRCARLPAPRPGAGRAGERGRSAVVAGALAR